MILSSFWRRILGMSDKPKIVDALGAYQASNILGTVSQSGGIPTGAIIQSGSNANGYYVRYADGTQICTGTMDEQTTDTLFVTGLYYNSTPSAGTFPIAFSAAPIVTFNAVRSDGTGAARLTGSMVTGTSTTAPGQVRSISNANTHKVTHTYVAIGRWF